MRIALVLIFLLCGVGAFAESQPPPENPLAQSNDINQTANNKIKPKLEKIISVKIIPAPDADAKAAKEEKKEQEKASTDKLIANSTFWLAVITGILAIFTGALWLATRKLVIDAKDTSKRQLRAYVNVLQGKVFYPHDPARRTFRIDIKNFGQTPAHTLSVVHKCVIREFPLDKSKPLEVTESEHGYFSVLAPTCIYRQDIAAPVNAEWAETKLMKGTAAIYCYGEIKYRDAFNNDQTTKFRYMCRGEGLANGDVSPCEEGNYAT